MSDCPSRKDSPPQRLRPRPKKRPIVELRPDGGFYYNGELVNADEPEAGKRLFRALCAQYGISPDIPSDTPVVNRTWSDQERTIEVWTEGFASTSQSAGAMSWGSTLARSLQEACGKIAVQKPKFKEYYDPARMTWWGCKIFDNEKDARRSFG